ncbi:CRISPR-associated endonuclease Cas1 [Cutibacterium granulosum]|uniref:CRISPR-associated endonuclease Cas1 n=1 Tax=Cutibacterium granulosum TaxID=33011 RepID=UPI0023F65327|nr:CRISPR-associated endonuclease Cas1 [Cutibacterium granulosum]
MPSEDPLPISTVIHTVFCPRRTWLEVSGEVTDTFQMQAGVEAHRGVDDAATARADEYRAVSIHSKTLDISGKCDCVRELPDGTLKVIEFKATPVRQRAAVTPAIRVQLALQVMCLEESGRHVSEASVWFTNHHTDVSIEITEQLRDEATCWVRATRQIVQSPRPPAALLNDPRCNRCSHASVCLPDETRSSQPARRISVARHRGFMIHVTTPGARAQIRRSRVEVVHKGEVLADLPLEKVDGLIVHGNADVSSALIRELLWRRRSVVWCSSRGRVMGWASTAQTVNGLGRLHQHEMSLHGSLPLAKGMIRAKIANQATMARRWHETCGDTMSLRSLQQNVDECRSLPEVFAVEGRAATLYFGMFPMFLKADRRKPWAQGWPGRQGRGAGDALNVCLNYSYGLLLSECIRALLACGLDPHAGILHSANRNKPAMALDLMEEFRPVIADSVVISAINNGQVKPAMLLSDLGDPCLEQRARKALISLHEKRMSTEITHPVFGYKVSWRRVIEVQARLVLEVASGGEQRYRGMTVR